MTTFSDLSSPKPVGWVLNSPYEEPIQHWELNRYGRATANIIHQRRLSAELVPVPAATEERKAEPNLEPYATINRLRKLVRTWRNSGYQTPKISSETEDLLEYFASDESAKSSQENFSQMRWEQPFFCQRECVETLVWLREVGDYLNEAERNEWTSICDKIYSVSEQLNDGVHRLAFKMATGTGKTKAMAMMIAWLAIVQNHRHFLIIAPNLTIGEQLQNLRYLAEEVVPSKYREQVRQSKITVLNFQKFQEKSTFGFSDKPSKTVKMTLRVSDDDWRETAEQMLERLLARRHGKEAKFVVINDEAHHCRNLPKSEGAEDWDDKNSAKRMMWFNAIHTLHENRQLELVLDFSATPMYLKVLRNLESVLFPWTVTDFPLLEAIETGLVKIPRVPTLKEGQDLARNIYDNTLDKKLSSQNLQEPVRSLLSALVNNHIKSSTISWRRNYGVEPVLIVVVNTIENAFELYKWIGGYQFEGKWKPGHYPELSNINLDGTGPKPKPPTMVVTSRLDEPEEKGERATLNEQIQVHAPELVGVRGAATKFRSQILREMFLNVGRKGTRGEHIRCVISVSMLTEGWDTRTVTSIFGFRKFGSALLCEQVAGRALRRTEHVLSDEGKFSECYADILGIPFEFLPTRNEVINPPSDVYEVFTVGERIPYYHMKFPNLKRYRINMPNFQDLQIDLNKVQPFYMPGVGLEEIDIEGAIGDTTTIKILATSRSSAEFRLASVCTENYINQFENDIPPLQRRVLFRRFRAIVREWLEHYLVNCHPSQISGNPLEPTQQTLAAVQAILKSLTQPSNDVPSVMPVFDNPLSLSTENTRFRTSKSLIYETKKSVLNLAVCDSNSELEVCQVLDNNDRIERWVRNEQLGWTIPWYDEKRLRWRKYTPDFVAEVILSDRQTLHLVIEFKGIEEHEDILKRETTERDWLTAVNHSDAEDFAGRWAYVYIKSNLSGIKLRRKIAKHIDEKIIQIEREL